MNPKQPIHIAFWHPKGGVGKSLLALHVAAACARDGLSVALVDLDPQRSAVWISGIDGKLPFPVYGGWPTERPDVDVLISDHPPRIEELPPGGIVVAPVRPVAHEIAALVAAIRRLGGRTVIPVVNFFDRRRRDHFANTAALDLLISAPRVSNRAVFERALNLGMTVFDQRMDRVSRVGAARAEIEMLRDAILARARLGWDRLG